MRFVHIEDIHWDICPDVNKSWGEERTQAVKNTFRIIIKKAREMDVGYLLVSGDLFHRQSLMRDLKGVNYLFSTIPAVKVILIAGNRDRIRENSALLSFTWSPNIALITDEALTSVYLENTNTEIRDFSYHTAEIKASLLEGIQVPLNSRIQILIAHGDGTAHLPINFSSLELSPSSCIVLGYIHEPHVLADGKITYYGSSESPDLTETGSHGSYAGEIHPITRRLISSQFIFAAGPQYTSLATSVSRDTTNGELCGCMSNEIENWGSQHICRFRIRGVRGPDTELDLKQLTVRYGITEIIDNSEPQYDFSALLAEHSSDMTGSYIQALQKEGVSPVEEKTLYYGVNALLHTTDERSWTREDVKPTHQGIWQTPRPGRFL